MFLGNLSKMATHFGEPIRYSIPLGDATIRVNDWIGRPLRIAPTGNFHCVACSTAIQKRYGQGFCYPCFTESPMNSECIVRPELCRAHVGQGRDMAWEEKHHNQPHVVYLANSGALKVGVTRDTQVPTRWIDQGAAQAIVIAKVPYRFLAGQIEVALKNHYGDKTHWQRMLRADFPLLDLEAERIRAVGYLPPDLAPYADVDSPLYSLHFPVTKNPTTIASVNLEKGQVAEGILMGVRGQYLCWDSGQVLNVRRYAGVEVNWSEGTPQPVQGSLF